MLHYAKSLVAAVAALVFTVYAAVSDKQISSDEWTAIATAWAAVLAVFAVPNKPAA